MILFIIKLAIFFIVLIYLVDRLIFFFKENLTIPKTKDLVNLTPKKYEEMLNTIKNRDKEKIVITETSSQTNNHMKEELTNFLKKQLKKNQESVIENNPITYFNQDNLRNENNLRNNNEPSIMDNYFENNNSTINFSLL